MTTRTIYFGAYNEGEADEMGIEAYEFNGTDYEYKAEIHLEDGFMRISDSVGRMVPFDMTSYASLAQVTQIAEAINTLQERRDLIDRALYDTPATFGL